MGQLFVVEYVGESTDGWRSAVQNAVSEAHKSFDNITGLEITGFKADVVDGKLANFQAKVKIYSE